MRSIKIIPALCILMLAQIASAQFYGGSKYSGVGLPFFEMSIFRTFNMDRATPRIDVYIELIHDDLTFVRNEAQNRYEAKFETVIAVYDEDENQVTSRIVNNDVYVQDYDLTNSREERLQLSRSLDLKEGSYILKVRVTDLISKQVLNRNLEFEIFDTQDQDIAVSDLLFLNELETDSSGNVISVKPRVRENFSRADDNFYIYLNVYSKKVPTDLTLKYSFMTSKEEVEYDSTVTSHVTKPVTSHIFKVDKRLLAGNSYRCVVEVENDEDDTEIARYLSFYWVTTPETGEDISLAIQQMRYLGIPDSIDQYEDAPYPEQRRFFEKYWAARDPNPDTAMNELMVEYYQRVNLANREFSNFNEGGWLSDRGRILIKFGQPDDIERHPFEIDTYPYEVWRYYALRKIFVFADRTGFGDYRLLPEYLDQEYH